MESTMKSKLVLASLIVITGLSACVVAPAPRAYYREPVLVAPPAPRVEYYGAPPVVGHVWIGGFWNWTGQRHEWVPGHWEAPRPGQVWVPHRWDNNGNRWNLQGGHWETGRRDHDRDHDHDRRDRRDHR